MCSLIITGLATFVPTVPDHGSAGLLAGVAIVSLGIVARLLKNRKR